MIIHICSLSQYMKGEVDKHTHGRSIKALEAFTNTKRNDEYSSWHIGCCQAKDIDSFILKRTGQIDYSFENAFLHMGFDNHSDIETVYRYFKDRGAITDDDTIDIPQDANTFIAYPTAYDKHLS